MLRSVFYAGFLMLLVTAGCEVVHQGDAASRHDAAGRDDAQPASSEQGRRTLMVFAAASLTDAFAAVEKAFEARHPDTDVVLNLAGSQQLAQQLQLGAPADVFAGANQQQMQAAVDAGRIDPATPEPFARNRLVVVLPKDNPAGLNRLQDLASPGLRLVIAADEVPVGRYSRLFLSKASADPSFESTYEQDVLARVASFEQSVRAVLTKVMLGEADAGIVYASDLVGAGDDGVRRIEIPDPLNVVASYPIARVSNSRQPDLARDFVDFVHSPDGQEILARYGFASSPPS